MWDEKQVLALGLNFAVTPTTIPIEAIIASTEATAWKLDTQTAEKLRFHISTVLQRASITKCNLLRYLRKVVKPLRSDESIVILPANKGNSTVVMVKSEYDEKLGVMLFSSTIIQVAKEERILQPVLRGRWLRC